VVLAANLSGTRTDGTHLDPSAEIRVLRMPATESLRPGAVSERYLVQQFGKLARPIATLSGGSLDAMVLDGRFLFVDREAAVSTPTSSPGAGASRSVTEPRPAATAAAAEVPAHAGAGHAGHFLYAIQVDEPQGRRSPLRSPALVEVCEAPATPLDLKAEVAEGEVRLQWGEAAGGAPEPPAAGAVPATASAAPAVLGFNVYRRTKSAPRDPESPLNPAPLDSAAFIDRTFTYDVDYVYFVRSVLAGRASLCESVGGAPVEVRPHDRFAPAAPSGVAVAAEGGAIRVYWFPNDEPDLAGYRIYRREGDAQVPAMVGEVPATETSFVDTGAKPGVRYHYSVSAVDSASPVNESPRSEERSEFLSPTASAGGQ
jgi:hypothetical protein